MRHQLLNCAQSIIKKMSRQIHFTSCISKNMIFPTDIIPSFLKRVKSTMKFIIHSFYRNRMNHLPDFGHIHRQTISQQQKKTAYKQSPLVPTIHKLAKPT